LNPEEANFFLSLLAQEGESHEQVLARLQHEPSTLQDKHHVAAPANLAALRTLQEGELPMLGLTFIRDASGPEALSKLSRYESTIERRFYKALHELQRLQAARAGQPIPPPAVVEVEVEVSRVS
jgi:hypothetical protein